MKKRETQLRIFLNCIETFLSQVKINILIYPFLYRKKQEKRDI